LLNSDGSSTLLWTIFECPNCEVTISKLVLFSPPPPPSSHSSAFWLWKGILKSQRLIAQGACHRISSSSSFSIWKAPWIPSLPAFTPSPINLSHISHSLLSIHDLLSPDNTWNTHITLGTFMLSIFYSSSIREILKLKVGPSSIPNFIWPFSTNGLFSSRSAFNQITFPRVNSAFSPFNPLAWKKLWKLQLNDRLKLFLWKNSLGYHPNLMEIKAPLRRISFKYQLGRLREHEQRSSRMYSMDSFKSYRLKQIR
jgi:hypothetical protein